MSNSCELLQSQLLLQSTSYTYDSCFKCCDGGEKIDKGSATMALGGKFFLGLPVQCVEVNLLHNDHHMVWQQLQRFDICQHAALQHQQGMLPYKSNTSC